MNTLQDQTIGFIGLGLMGRPMALNLQDAGARVIVHNRSQGVVKELAALGLTPAATPRAVAAEAGIVVVMVSDTPAVEAILTGNDGLLAGLRPGSLVIDMGTTAVTPTKTFAAMVEGRGGLYVDAPVSGGQIGAESGNLTIMAGGTEEGFARAMPLFTVLGKTITHVGPTGAGQVAKAANQVIVGLTIGAVAEALALARRAGVDPMRLREALLGGFASSRVLDVHGKRMAEGEFQPGGKVTTQRKDLAQALELAEHLGLEMPATELNMTLYDRLIAAGHGGLDHSALIKVIERDEVPK